jgi:D-arabinose 1-dehydrogenase-like Zn-dependent alcohol dehydrogenase
MARLPPPLLLLSVLLLSVQLLARASYGHSLLSAENAATPPATMKHVIAKGLKPCKAPPFSCVQAVSTNTPKPALGEVLVRLTSSSVNPSDLDMEEQVGRLEGTLGVDFAGTVVEIGSGVKRLKVGDSVWGVTKGAYAEYVIAVELVTGVVPVGLNISVAGTIPEVGATSLQALQRLGAPWDAKRNITVVITSGTGGTGEVTVHSPGLTAAKE